METKRWGPSSFIAALAAVTVLSCGGRVLPVDGTGSGDASGSGGTPANGGTPIGGRPPTGGKPPIGGLPSAGVPPIGGYPAGGGLPGSCNPTFCAARPGAYGCCLGPNGPCGIDIGRGCEPNTGQCIQDYDCPPPPVPCQVCADGTCAPSRTYCAGGSCVTEVSVCPVPYCDPALCPPSGSGKPCCPSPYGPCGVDYGMGCIPQPPPCMGCPPPPLQVGAWYKSCPPQFCTDAGQPNLPLCDKGMQPGGPCAPVGQACLLYYCGPILVCSLANPCLIPL